MKSSICRTHPPLPNPNQTLLRLLEEYGRRGDGKMTSNGTEKGSGTVKGSAHQIGRLGAHCTNLKHWKVREEKILWKMYRIHLFAEPVAFVFAVSL